MNKEAKRKRETKRLSKKETIKYTKNKEIKKQR